MPKTYSDDERAYIKERLEEEAAYMLSTLGIKRTTVDQLVERVKIPKGMFYQFYDSKELLLFHVIMKQHAIIEQQMLDHIVPLRDQLTVDGLTEIIYHTFKTVDETGLLRLIATGEIELLYRKLPQQLMHSHFSHDTAMINRMIELLALSCKPNVDYFATAFRIFFISIAHKREIGELYFDEALKLSIRGLVLQLLA